MVSCVRWYGPRPLTQDRLVKRGKPLARTAMVAGRKRLPPRSARRSSEVDARRDLVGRVLARDGHACRAPAQLAAVGLAPWPACWGPLDVHEVITRASWPAGYLVDANTKTLCRSCHDHAHEHPVEAIEAGLLALSTAPRPTNPTTKETP